MGSPVEAPAADSWRAVDADGVCEAGRVAREELEEDAPTRAPLDGEATVGLSLDALALQPVPALGHPITREKVSWDARRVPAGEQQTAIQRGELRAELCGAVRSDPGLRSR